VLRGDPPASPHDVPQVRLRVRARIKKGWPRRLPGQPMSLEGEGGTPRPTTSKFAQFSANRSPSRTAVAPGCSQPA
jgi:hypothetical protein